LLTGVHRSFGKDRSRARARIWERARGKADGPDAHWLRGKQPALQNGPDHYTAFSL